MITTITGKNHYQSHRMFHDLVDSHLAEHGDISVERFSGEDLELNKLQEALQSLPFLAARKLVIIRGIASQKGLHDSIQDYLADVPESTDVVIYDPELDKRTTFYKFLNKQTTMHAMSELDEFALVGWVAEEASKRDIQADRSVLSLLVQRVGADQWQLHNELEKLRNHPQPITKKIIEDVIALNPRDTIFEMLDMTLQGNDQKAVTTLARLKTLGLDAHYVMSMLAWQLHIMSLLVFSSGQSPDQIGRQAKISPYVLRKAQVAAKRMSKQELSAVLAMMVAADSKLKSAPVDADLVVRQLVSKIARTVA